MGAHGRALHLPYRASTRNDESLGRQSRGNLARSGGKWSKVGRDGEEEPVVSDVAVNGMGPTGVFLGTFTPRLDDKGRLILPAKFRPRLATGLVCTRGLD